MKSLLYVLSTVAMTALAWAQGTNAAALNPVRPFPVAPNTPRFGNILYPGGTPSFPTQLGNSISGTVPGYGGVPAGRPGNGGGRGGGYGGGHGGGYGGRGRTVVVPYAIPVYGGYGGVYGGGYGGGYYDAPPTQSPTNVTVVVPQQPAPSVIINQTFASGEPALRTEIREYSATSTPDGPDSGGVRIYEAPKRRSEASSTPPAEERKSAAPAPTYVRDDKPTIYLIAMKDSSVRQAIGYWIERDQTTLAFVTPQASITRVSLNEVDREMSVQLNAERKLDFELTSR